MKRAALLWFVAGLVVAGGASVWMNARGARQEAAVAAPAVRYHCPMHPSYVSDKPGDCPICGMKLVPMESEAEARGSKVPGRANLSLTPERLQVLGIRSEEIHHGPLTRVIRTVGRVAVDERRLHHIHTKYEGYVEHLYVDFTGKYVQRDEHLLSIYSPELVATQQEYLLAYTRRSRWPTAGSPRLPRGRSTCSRRRASGCCSGTCAARTSRRSRRPARSGARSTCTPRSPATWSRRWPSTACG